MKKLYLLLFISFCAFKIHAQYKNDNVLFKTIFAGSLCDSLNLYPERLILDVRSPAEFNEEDIKDMSGMKLGHFKEAVNIDVQQLGSRLSEIQQYKNMPVFVICSHSQRSRRASILLANNGFTHVLNINGGMTSLRQLPVLENRCIYDKIFTISKFELMSLVMLCDLISKDSPIYLLDVRSNDAFNYKGKAIENSYGMLAGTHHIALKELSDKWYDLPQNKKIVITDVEGNDGEQAATILLNNKFSNVSVLFGGMENFLVTKTSRLTCKTGIYKSPVAFHIIGSEDLCSVYPSLNHPIFLDIRSTEEYANKSKDSYKNIGCLKDAINISFDDLPFRMDLIKKYKNDPVIVYGFSSNPESYSTAQLLVNNGFSNVYVLSRGLFNVRWTLNNIKGNEDLAKLVVNIPNENL